MALIFQWVCGEILHVFSFSLYSLIYSFRFWDGVIQEFHVPFARKALLPSQESKSLKFIRISEHVVLLVE